MSTASKAPNGPKQSTAIATRPVSLAALMRKRAKDQFDSVKRGDGPLPVGQLAPRQVQVSNSSSSVPKQAEPSLSTGYTVRNADQVRLPRTAGSNEAKSSSATPQPVRTIRVKASKAQLRPTATGTQDGTYQTLQPSSPNVPAAQLGRVQVKQHTPGPYAQSQQSHASSPLTPAMRARPRVPDNTPAAAGGMASLKTQQITASPVMSAMLRSRIPQATARSLKETAHSPGLVPGHGKARFAAGSSIVGGGGGIKVKVAPVQMASSPMANRKQTQQPVPGTIKTSTQQPMNTVRVKATGTPMTARPTVLKAPPRGQ